MPGSRHGRAVVALAVVACLVVFGTAGFAAVVAVSGGSPSADRTSDGLADPLNPRQTGGALPDPAFPSAQAGVFADDNAYFEVPGYQVGWLKPSGTGGSVVFWDVADGQRVSIEGAALYGIGVCGKSRVTGYAGIPAVADTRTAEPDAADDQTDPATVGRDVVTTYARAVGYNERTGEQAEVPEPTQEDWTLADGTPAVFTVVTVDLPPGGHRCDPKQSEVAGVTFDSGERLVTLLVGRDLDYADVVTKADREDRPPVDEETRDGILRSARPLS